MSGNNNGFTTIPFPKLRRLMVDGGRMGKQKHTIHALVEMDVTCARQIRRDHRAQTGESPSFTAFLIYCLGQAIETNKQMQAYRSWRDQFVIFDDVDVSTMFEVEVDGKKIVRPHIMRAVNKKSIYDLHKEIRKFQAEHNESREAKFIDWFVRMPGFIRRIFYTLLFKNPHMLKDYFGTVIFTSVSMFGSGAGWAIPVPNHTLQMTVGGIVNKPGVVDGRIEVREYLSVTISFDHDIVDGAPAARFVHQLQKMIESGYGFVDNRRKLENE